MQTQDQLKIAVAQAAVDYVAQHMPAGGILGVGTGSTANYFIEALARAALPLAGAVASSEATRQRLERHGIPVFDLNDVDTLPIYVDGADEIDAGFNMIKGGGGALTREKIVAAVARTFVCICDASKRVAVLGKFALPVEVIPMARAHVTRALSALAKPVLREGFMTDNGNLIIDVQGLTITNPPSMERQLNQITGVVTNGLFALRGADVLLLASTRGVEKLEREG